MDLKDYINQAYDYVYWANGRYLDVAAGLTDEQLHRKLGHSWDSVHATLVHMMSSERVWLGRWHGASPAGHLDPADFPSVASVRSAWAGTEKEMRLFIDSQKAEDLLIVITYSNFRGETFHVPLWQMLMHVANHETHHRGELAAMFALMQIPHPEDEVIQYFLNLSGQRKF